MLATVRRGAMKSGHSIYYLHGVKMTFRSVTRNTARVIRMCERGTRMRASRAMMTIIMALLMAIIVALVTASGSISPA